MQAGSQASGSVLFLVCLFFVTNESCAKRSGIVQANNISGSITMCPGCPGLTDETGYRGPE